MLEEKGIGVLIVNSMKGVRLLSPERSTSAGFFHIQVSLSLTNARLSNQSNNLTWKLPRPMMRTLLGWSLALDMRDQVTQGHARRVVDLTIELAQQLGIS